MPIFNANKIPLSQGQGTIPNVQTAMNDWFQSITFVKVTKSVVNFQNFETYDNICFMGIVEPIQGQALEIRQNGQRKWMWYTVWTVQNIALVPDDIFNYQGKPYRVMKKYDWSMSGYYQYEIREDYT